MSAIWKFTLPIEDEARIDMPVEAIPLCVQVQGRRPCVWAIVEPKNPIASRLFYVRGTGHEMGSAALGKYLGSFQLIGRRFGVPCIRWGIQVSVIWLALTHCPHNILLTDRCFRCERQYIRRMMRWALGLSLLFWPVAGVMLVWGLR